MSGKRKKESKKIKQKTGKNMEGRIPLNQFAVIINLYGGSRTYMLYIYDRIK